MDKDCMDWVYAGLGVIAGLTFYGNCLLYAILKELRKP